MFLRNIQHYIPQDSTLHGHHCENLIPYNTAALRVFDVEDGSFSQSRGKQGKRSVRKEGITHQCTVQKNRDMSALFQPAVREWHEYMCPLEHFKETETNTLLPRNQSEVSGIRYISQELFVKGLNYFINHVITTAENVLHFLERHKYAFQ